MSFPDIRYESAGDYLAAYAERLQKAANSVDRLLLQKAADALDALYAARNVLYVCGNGGSAAIADTFVCDHAKLVQTDTILVPRVHSLASNGPMVTAIANDLSYADVFAYQLRTLAQPGDALLCISASGDSENVVRAASWAKANNHTVIAFTGFSGGRLRGLADISLHVDGDNYGVIEDTHQSLMHVLAQYVRLRRMDARLIAERKF
jgi:D-sedoheptulose 7-phosphate isomerase